jgi:hypothetical protein
MDLQIYWKYILNVRRGEKLQSAYVKFQGSVVKPIPLKIEYIISEPLKITKAIQLGFINLSRRYIWI